MLGSGQTVRGGGILGGTCLTVADCIFGIHSRIFNALSKRVFLHDVEGGLSGCYY